MKKIFKIPVDNLSNEEIRFLIRELKNKLNSDDYFSKLKKEMRIKKLNKILK